MTDYKNHPDANKPLTTGRVYKGRKISLKFLTQYAIKSEQFLEDVIWDALNNRYVRMVRVWKERYARQRQHALQLQNLLTEKNAYIRELQDEIQTLKAPDFFAK
jgi:hypothetical protein